MQLENTQYPTAWKKKFALFPVQLGRTDEGPLLFWEEYKERKTDRWTWEHRALKGNVTIYVHTPATSAD